MSEEFEYFENPEVKKTEEVWCQIDENGNLSIFNWEIVERMAKEYDQCAENVKRDNGQIIAKLAMLIRQQTIRDCADVLQKYVDNSPLRRILVLKEQDDE